MKNSNQNIKLKHISKFISRGVSPDYSETVTGIKFINQACIYWGGLKLDAIKYARNDSGALSSKGRIQINDILVNSTGTGTLGRATIFNVIDDNYVADSHITIIRPDINKVLPRFLYYILRSSSFQDYIYTTCVSGSTNQIELSRERLRELHINVPKIDNQKRMVMFLDYKIAKIDEAIAKKKKLLKLLEEKRTTSIELNLKKQISKHKTVQKHLKYIAKINNNTLSEGIDSNRQIRYIDIGSVDVKGFNGIYQEFAFSDAPSRARRLLSPGSTIIATVRTYLKAVAYFEDPATDIVVSTGFAVLDPNKDIYPKFLYYNIVSNNFIQKVEANSVGVSYPAINPSELGMFSINIPISKKIQEEIVKYLDEKIKAIDIAKEKIYDSILLLEEYKTSLISNAVNGRMKI